MAKIIIVNEIDNSILEELKVSIAPQFVIYRGRLLELIPGTENHYIEKSYLEIC